MNRCFLQHLSLLVSGLIFVGLISCRDQSSKKNKKIPSFEQVEHLYLNQIDSCIVHLEEIQKNTEISVLEAHFRKARQYFKQVEVILSYAESENYNTLNEPNLLRVHEEDLTNIKIREAQGFQVLEETIFADSVHQERVAQEAEFIKNRLQLIRSNTNFNHFKNYHFLWMVRNEIIRVAFAGITGFDSPVLLNSLQDSKAIYESISNYLTFFEAEFQDKDLYEKWQNEISKTQKILQEGDFDTFNRYDFIQKRTHTQITLWNQTVKDWKVEFPFEMAIKNDAPDLFSPQIFNLAHFSGNPKAKLDKDILALGKTLFYDPSLSGNKKMSCGTCHAPELAFTDGQPKAIGNKGKPVLRNSPVLLYAGLQKGFFHDSRASTLEEQILGVIENPDEFNTTMEAIVETVQTHKEYRNSFEKLYQNGVTGRNIREAIALYVWSLTPFNSKFDRNIRQEENTLTTQEIKGFNLFMGKAICATCHFPPAFNGTVPPLFTETELESLGVPFDAKNDKLDTDLGRYYYFKTKERKHFFKTMTVRNIEKTAPYMHNGAYQTLEEVMEFYDVGGGLGMGFDVPLQTLPSDSLHLTEEEEEAIIAFMKTLTDDTDFGNLSDY